MDNYRSLTLDEIETLERSGCTAEDWNNINVSEDFTPAHVYNTVFCGEINLGVFDKHIEIDEGFMRHSGIFNATLHNVTIGDNCLIENTGNYISGYVIGEECYISNVGRMTGDETATFGECTPVAVLNEAGEGNVIIYDGLTSQMAAFMVAAAKKDKVLHGMIRDIVKKDAAARHPASPTVGYRVKIVNTREIINTTISDDTEINCASRLYDCTLSGTEDASVYIGNDVICENTIISAGASVLGGAKLYNCFVGEACHVGKGFSAENSLFFANSYMDNGEACAAFCGPFTVSHHKSTLLIGGMFSFYNAGSATNYSNHAYKIGPIHYGTLERGTKTASGAHILMPATIGAFSMCMGKIQNHPDTADMPFSYIIASADKTYLVPGCNLMTVGTYRDTGKWPKRDMRPHTGKRSIVNFDWLSPYTIQKAIKGKKELERIRIEQGYDADEYEYGSCTIRNSALTKGIRIYDMAVRMFFSQAVSTHPCTLPQSTQGTGEWTDLAGMLVPKDEATRLADDIRNGGVSTLADIAKRLADMNDGYSEWMWNWTYSAILNYYGLENITNDDIGRIARDGEEAFAAWHSAIAHDAEKEALLGDVDEETLNGFLASIRTGREY